MARVTKNETISLLTDPFSMENASRLSETDLKYLMKTMIEAYNDGNLVFRGTAFDFLNDNQFNETVTELCLGLKRRKKVEYNDYHSGQWIIVKVK